MTRGWIGLLAALALLPTPAAAALRAVFIGIDHYAYSQTKVPEADFKDLSGAVSDARHIKEALRAAYAIDLDTETAGQCASANAVSITLVNECATRKAIFDAWQKQIAASAKGDTLILYFAGHGSQFVDSQIFDQSSGYNDTILPYDARQPGADVEADILDREIKTVIDTATAKGVNVVTIFDSCHSGTAARDGPAEGQSRDAPPRRMRGVVAAGAPVAPGIDEGYRVHFAAAADGEEAREVGAVGKRAGVFTTALAQTLSVMPNAAFADIATEVRLKVAETGHTAQRPQAEGALTASMGGGERRIPLLTAVNDRGAIWLAGGQLNGVTAGSTYALFAKTGDALDDGAKPLATGQVSNVETARATLTIDPPSASLPPQLIARETAHAFGEEVLLVRNSAAPEDSAAIATMLQAMKFVRVAPSAPFAIVPTRDGYKLVGADGIAVASLGSAAAADFSNRLRIALQKIARVQVLLALRSDATRADVQFCIGNDLDANAFACKAVHQSDGPVLKLNANAKLIAINRAAEPRYIYVFAIDDSFAVNLAVPDHGGLDSAVAPGRPIVAFGKPDSEGRLIFLTLSTDQPINASVLEQSGAGARDPAACNSILARALCAAQQGARDPAVPRVGNWTAVVTQAIIRK
ncbi:hypothetical protein ACFB49_16850 [Sphingomonas sp. DBB INV C78]|uniref:caspase family protein n=1 Tax=Sphingomonas sp. DBB INV C78 TaxID=3349434 RepID=UPI0036D38370